jgi:NAD(P)H-hydrate epimerase
MFVSVVCGTGNNGGDGFVAVRHLINAGVKVKVFVVGPKAKLKNDPKVNLNILQKMGQRVKWVKAAKDLRGINKSALIIDALFGIGLNQPVSGLNADTGEIMGAAVEAKTTVTFVAPKKGFFKRSGPRCCGKIVVRDIGAFWVER